MRGETRFRGRSDRMNIGHIDYFDLDTGVAARSVPPSARWLP